MVFEELEEEQLSKFKPKKLENLRLANVYHEISMRASPLSPDRDAFLSRYVRVAECGTFLQFHVTDTAKKLFSANFCKDRLCPMCNWRRSLKIFGQASAVMNLLESEKKYRFIFLTLTVKNCIAEDLSRTVQMLLDGWRFMYHKDKRFMKIAKGTFRTLEVTRNVDKTSLSYGTYHPHLHVIIAVNPSYFKGKDYVTQKEFRSMWRSACDLDYDPRCDVKVIKPDVQNRKDGVISFSKAVAEVSKYAVKSADFLSGTVDDSVSYVRAFLEALSGRRLIGYTGCFAKARKQLRLDDLETGDLVHVEGEQLRDDVAYMVVRYRWCAGVYVAEVVTDENGEVKMGAM